MRIEADKLRDLTKGRCDGYLLQFDHLSGCDHGWRWLVNMILDLRSSLVAGGRLAGTMVASRPIL
jgi:hypothetical protein